jgi:hypothetical protein
MRVYHAGMTLKLEEQKLELNSAREGQLDQALVGAARE